MVIALALLSLAMILGGIYAALQGWSIVLLERGWTLMISGSVAAASGALLLGITAVVLRLGSIRNELAELRERMAAASHPVPPPPAFDPVDALSASLLSGAGQGPDSVRTSEGEGQPSLPMFMRPADERVAGPVGDRKPPHFPVRDEEHQEGQEVRAAEPATRLRLPDFLFPRRSTEPSAPDAEMPMREPEEELRREPEPLPFEAAEAPEREPEPEPEPEPAPLPEAAEQDAEEPTVVGSYSSGDNRYVMFSDGSIEAHTPRGVYRFGSLDELKEFIASGGEERSTTP